MKINSLKIEDLHESYSYDVNFNLRIIKLKKKLSKANAEKIDMVNDLIKIEEDKLNKKKNSLEILLNSFVNQKAQLCRRF